MSKYRASAGRFDLGGQPALQQMSSLFQPALSNPVRHLEQDPLCTMRPARWCTRPPRLPLGATDSRLGLLAVASVIIGGCSQKATLVLRARSSMSIDLPASCAAMNPDLPSWPRAAAGVS